MFTAGILESEHVGPPGITMETWDGEDKDIDNDILDTHRRPDLFVSFRETKRSEEAPLEPHD